MRKSHGFMVKFKNKSASSPPQENGLMMKINTFACPWLIFNKKSAPTPTTRKSCGLMVRLCLKGKYLNTWLFKELKHV